MMKTLICLFVMSLTLACCKSREKMMYSGSGYVTTEPVVLNVREAVRDTIVIEEEKEMPEQEEVVRTHGDELMRYCVIVGSFIYRQNAVRLRNRLMSQGFIGSSVMQNSEGMYRVSAVCSNDYTDAQNELTRIRCRYPQFRDAWLLETR